ncbi:MAG: hypothetical protein ACI9OJ_004008 [Myxococcota bacterium]|jgi:hypothetical protein
MNTLSHRAVTSANASARAYYDDDAPCSRKAFKVGAGAFSVLLVGAAVTQSALLVQVACVAALAVAASMLAVLVVGSRIGTPASRRRMSHRLRSHFLRGQIFSFAFAGVCLIPAAVFAGSLFSMCLATTLAVFTGLAALTPFCIGRLLYAVSVKLTSGVGA